MPQYVNVNTSDVVTFPEPNARLDRLENWIRLDVDEDTSPTPAPQEQTKDDLLQDALERGVDVDRRWGVKRLQEALAAGGL